LKKRGWVKSEKMSLWRRRICGEKVGESFGFQKW